MRLPPSEADTQGPNLTPIIDVVFLLLIFFLVATRFDQQEKEISTRLPQVSDAQPLSQPPGEVIVNITEKGDYVVVGKTLEQDGLASFLKEISLANPGTQKVQIRADDRVQFRFPATVMGMCEQENIDHYCTVVQQIR